MPSDSCVRGSDGCEIKGRHDMCGTVLGPDQERSEPSPAERIEKVLDELAEVQIISEGVTTANMAAMFESEVLPILTRLVEATERAAKREALLSVAHRLKTRAALADATVQNGRVDREVPQWRLNQDAGAAAAYHEAWKAVHDALSALESLGEAK